MNLDYLLKNFDLIAEMPGGVARLRELILELAVSGKLVKQFNEEQTAEELLNIARNERSNLEKQRIIKVRPTLVVNSDEQPYSLPASWQWCRLSDIGHELKQTIPDKLFSYIDVGSIDSKTGVISDRVEVLEPASAPSRARKLVSIGTVIYSTVRPYLRNIAIVDRKYKAPPIASTAFGVLYPFANISSKYVFYWLRSKDFSDYAQSCMQGMAYPAINDEKFYNGYIPLPPLAEQKRIVAKVDELMALCDQLDAQMEDARKVAERVVLSIVGV